MIYKDGSFSFIQEIAEIVEAFLRQYQERQGPFKNPLERSLVVAYVLGALRDEVEDIWQELDASLAPQGVSSKEVYEERLYFDRQAPERLNRIRSLIRDNGWGTTEPS